MITDKQVKELELKANSIRMSIIDMLEDAGSGHTAGPLDMADVFTALYFNVLNHNPKKPDWEERDRVILSNGHICPVMYATIAHAGYFPLEELKTLRKFGSRLQGHPEHEKLPGLETTSGPLGSGLSQAAGMALAFKMDNKKNHVYCLMGDGELNEGNVWEAAMFAGNNKLGNLTVIVDRNNIQITGNTEQVMPLEPLGDKWNSFNFEVMHVDSHSIHSIIEACEYAKTINYKPTVIIAHTIAGKGIKEIEYDFHWHGIPPNKEQEEKWLAELRTLQGKIEKE